MGLSFRHDFNLNLVNSICTSTQTVKILFYHYTQGIGHPFSGFSHSFKCRPLNETPGIEKKMPVGYLQDRIFGRKSCILPAWKEFGPG